MKFSCSFCVFLCCVVGAMSQTTQSAKEKQRKDIEVRRSMRTCIVENKVTYTLAIQYGKGDFKDTSDKAKCFLKCFAVKMKLFDAENGNPQNEELLSYASYLSSADLPFSDMIDKCDKETERSDDQCDFVFRMYKCLWDEIKNSPEPESFRMSFNDVFGFNELYDEGEIKAELEATTQEDDETENAETKIVEKIDKDFESV